MKSATLSQVQELFQLSDAALLNLLEEGHVVCKIMDDGKVRVDLESLTREPLLQAMLRMRRQSAVDPLLKEQVSSIIAENLENIVQQALALVKTRLKDQGL
jgi:hypothetical protein